MVVVVIAVVAVTIFVAVVVFAAVIVGVELDCILGSIIDIGRACLLGFGFGLKENFLPVAFDVIDVVAVVLVIVELARVYLTVIL